MADYTDQEAAFLSHLVLDDIAEGGLTYLFPLYNETISVYSFVDVKFAQVDLFYYNVACFVAIFFISCEMLMAIFALNKPRFEFEYKSPAKQDQRKSRNNFKLMR